jgi:ketosteroid isomerase-like protein
MKRTLLWCVAGLLALGNAGWLQAQSKGTEKTIVDLEQQWLKSQKTNNPDLVAPLIADNFWNTSNAGELSGRTEMLKQAKATKYESVDYEDLKVTVTGNTAIATGIFKGKGTNPSGKAFENYERFTDTWVKMGGGKWKCVASHQSEVKK